MNYSRSKSRSGNLKKSWGQHLLVNETVLETIASEVSSSAGGNPVIEFAAGTGNLTEYLLKKCNKVIAIEMERDVISKLKARFSGNGSLEIIEMNMMQFDFEKYFEKYGRLTVAANLPYNLSKLFLFRLFENAAYIKDACLMFQKEVAERITARPGDRDWSAMSVFATLLSSPSVIIRADRNSFSPPPRVDSAVVYMQFYDDVSRYLLYRKFDRMVQDIFNYPRKSLRNIIRSRFGEKYLIEISGRVDLSKRPQNLTLDDIEFIYRVISENENGA